jgi:predicted deacylase
VNDELFIAPDPVLEGVTRISTDPAWPRPHVLIVGALHGNERCGLVAIERLRDAAQLGELRWSGGTLVLVHGNLHASEVGTRHTDGGADLNRLFDYAFEASLPPEQWSHEHRRAVELRPIVDDADALLDLHSATAETPPFAIATAAASSYELARQLGLGWVVRGWEGPGLVGDQVMLSVLTRKGFPGVAVECGQHEDPAAGDVGYRCARRFLVAAGVLVDNPGSLPPTPGPLLLRLTEVIKKPSPSFRFVRPIRGLERLERGALIGGDEALEVRLRHASYALIPNDNVEVGGDMIYLAEPESDPEAASSGPR